MPSVGRLFEVGIDCRLFRVLPRKRRCCRCSHNGLFARVPVSPSFAVARTLEHSTSNFPHITAILCLLFLAITFTSFHGPSRLLVGIFEPILGLPMLTKMASLALCRAQQVTLKFVVLQNKLPRPSPTPVTLVPLGIFQSIVGVPTHAEMAPRRLIL